MIYFEIRIGKTTEIQNPIYECPVNYISTC